MATRRNVPSKDAFRAIKTTLVTSRWTRQTQVRDADFVVGRRSYNTNTSSDGRCPSYKALLLCAPRGEIVRPTRELHLCMRPSHKSAASQRAFSLPRQLTSNALVQLSDARHPSDTEDEAQHTDLHPHFRILRVEHSSVGENRKNGYAEKKNRPRDTEMVDGRVGFDSPDRQPPLKILKVQYSSVGVKRKDKSKGKGGRTEDRERPRKSGMPKGRTGLRPAEPELKPEENIDHSTAEVPPYVAPNQRVPVYTPHRAVFYKERTSRNLDPRCGYLYSRILVVRDSQDDHIALRVAASILDSYVKTKLDRDWQLVRELYMGLCYRFSPDGMHTIRNPFIRAMLQETPPRLEAVSLLLEPTEPDSPMTARHVRSYLSDFCAEVSDSDLQLAEAEKILQGIPAAASALKSAVLLPLVRSALEAKSPDRARDLIVKLSEAYDLPVDFRVLTDLVNVYAREGDWSATDTLLEDLHFRGYSRSKPYAFAALVRTIYLHFSTLRNPSRMFDFLTYSMRNQGLVPTTMLSASVIKDFVAFRRYDLVQRFVHARQMWFPNILNSIDTPLAAYEVAEAWTHSGASPTDVLATCKALAYGNVRDPFSEEFRHMTNTYLLRLLYKSLRVLTKQIGMEEHASDIEHSSSLEDMFNHIDQLSNLASNRALDLRSSLLFNTFRKQVEAAHEAEFLVNDFPEYIQQRGMIPKIEADDIQPKKSTKKAIYTPNLPAEVLALPGHSLADKVANLYQNANHSEEGDERDVVVTVMRYLQQNQRHRDCTILVRHFWKSGSVESKFVIHEVVKCWLRMAFELRDPKTLHEALWAAVDADPIHITGYRLLMLVRAAVSVIMEEVHLGRLKQYPNQLEELKYLVSRCYRRRWQQDGCPEAKNIADPYLKRWKMEQDSLEQDASVFIRPAYIF